MTERLSIVLCSPGEAEMPLLAELDMRDDLVVVAVVDPTGLALGTAIAEIMGLPVVPSLEMVSPSENGVGPLVALPTDQGSLAAEVSAAAEKLGLSTIRIPELKARLSMPTVRPERERPTASNRANFAEIEKESEAIQETLVGLEDALAGDTVLRRLLGLCTRAVGASGGSIMLFDNVSRDLYIAYATGLSEGTLHRTRVKLGEGIAGRVARTRRAELVQGNQRASSRHRDRPDIDSAICAPLQTGDRLLGVLNVSSRTGESTLDSDALEILTNLSDRLGRIIDGVQRLQQQRTSRMFNLTEQQLRRIAGEHEELPAMITAWAEALGVTTEADRVDIVVPCEDGSLLVCAGEDGEDGRHWYEPLSNPAWIEVLGSGLPMVARQDTNPDDDAEPVTVFYLPVGRDPVRAGLSMQFSRSRSAHHFHALAGETVFLLERLLPDQVDHRRQERRSNLLSSLSESLAKLAGHEGTPGQLANEVADKVMELTGAEHVAAIASVDDGLTKLAGGNVPEDAPWLTELPRLLEAVGAEPWRVTTLESVSGPLSVLCVTARPGTPTPGLVLIGKKRTHDLDGLVFTALDAELVTPLAGLLGRLPRPKEPEKLLLPKEHSPDMPRLNISMVPLAMDIENQPDQRKRTGEEHLLEDIRREIDRCDRYHNVFGLIMLCPDLPSSSAVDLFKAATDRLRDCLRISDRIYICESGSIAVMVPEDVQQLDRVQSKLVEKMRDIAGNQELSVAAGRVAYPATGGTAEEFLKRLRDRLQA